MARYSRTQSITHPIGPNGRAILKVTSADVRVRPATGDAASVRAAYTISARSDEDADAVFERAKLETSLGAGELRLEEPMAGDSLTGIIGRALSARDGFDLEVEIDLPPSAELRVETVSGEITVDGMRGEQRYATTSGDIYLNGGGGSLRVNTVSGDIVARAEGPLSARVQAVSGDLVLSTPRIDALRVQTVSGDVEIDGQLARTGEHRVETVSGDFGLGLVGDAAIEVRGISTDISSDLDHRVEGRLDRRRLVIGSGEPAVVFSSMSGDLSVRRPRRAMPPLPPEPSEPASPGAAAPDDAEQLVILEALARGEIDVDEAARRLAGGRTNA
jgi:hypothetical protein